MNSYNTSSNQILFIYLLLAPKTFMMHGFSGCDYYSSLQIKKRVVLTTIHKWHPFIIGKYYYFINIIYNILLI